MAIHIIVDGYNLIRQSPALSLLDRRDIALGREALIAGLAAYRKVKPHRVTVVFDGVDAPGPSADRDVRHGIHILFSPGGKPPTRSLRAWPGRSARRRLWSARTPPSPVPRTPAAPPPSAPANSNFAWPRRRRSRIRTRMRMSPHRGGWTPARKGPAAGCPGGGAMI